MDSDWMTPAEAAEAVGMTWRHVLAAADRGDLPAYLMGRKDVGSTPADVNACAATDPQPPELPATERQQVRAALAEGATVRDLAALHDVSISTIRNWAADG